MRACALPLFLFCTAVFGQTFEVASVKVSDGNGTIGFATGPASVSARAVRGLTCVAWAFDVQEFQVVGPGWLEGVYFDIFAKSAGPATPAELHVMMQKLLADRFQLTVHHESKEKTTYVLTVSKGGHKLEPVEAEGSPSFQTGNLNLTGKGATLAQLTAFLSTQLREPVVDQTGLTGRFNYFLNIEPYFSEESRKAQTGNGPPPDGAAIIATALQAQLGLKVETKKAMVDMIVVDHMEKAPAEQ